MIVELVEVANLRGEQSDDPEETSALVIDFNHAEDLGDKQSSEHERKARTVSKFVVFRLWLLRLFSGNTSLHCSGCRARNESSTPKRPIRVSGITS